MGAGIRLVALAAVLGVTVPHVAAAQGPVMTVERVNRTALSSLLTQRCGFPVQLHQEGVVRTVSFSDQNGNPVRDIQTGPWKTTFTNLNTGGSITSVEPFSARTTYHADGSFTVIVTGPRRRIVVPGEGLIAAEIGRAVWTFDALGAFTAELFSAGLNDPASPSALCQALAVVR